jgi:hypothetical protein
MPRNTPKGPRRRTPYTPTRPKYGMGGKPTGKAAYISARHGAGMKGKVAKHHKRAHPLLKVNRSQFIKRLSDIYKGL